MSNLSARDRDNSGVLFTNDKDGNDARPDFRGNIIVDGKKYSLACWKKTGQKGEFLTLSVSEWRERPNQKTEELFS